MKIIDFSATLLKEIKYLNAGSGRSGFYEERLPIHHARVDALPVGLDAVVVTADLQGRERFQESPGGPPRLLGEALPLRLVQEILPEVGIHDPSRVAVWLAGDFYTVPALDKRGGTGDVSAVWRAFGDEFAWVAGVAGNHDTYGENSKARPRFPAHLITWMVISLNSMDSASEESAGSSAIRNAISDAVKKITCLPWNCCWKNGSTSCCCTTAPAV